MGTYLMTENREFLCTTSSHTWLMKAILQPWIDREQTQHEEEHRQEVEKERQELEAAGEKPSWGFGVDSRNQDPDYFRIFAKVFQMADRELPLGLDKAQLSAKALSIAKLYRLTENELEEFLPRARQIITDMAKRGISAHLS